MTDQRTTAIQPEQLHKGVFQPSRAQIAREMKCRLELSDPGDDDQRPASFSPDRR